MASNFILKAVSGTKRVEINGTLTAGRNPDCDLVLSVGHPSRRHAELSLEDDRVWIKDLGSANGTFVNDRQVTTERYALNAGDRVRFDAEEFVLESTAPAAADENATVLRRPDDPAGHQTVIAQNRPRTPGSWADPDARGGQGTVLFDPKQLEAMKASGPVTTPMEPVDAPYLVVDSGKHKGERLKLKPGRETNVWEIGSDAGRDIRIDDPGVSAFHSKVVNEGNRWKIIDQMSANGTYVNGTKSNISYLKHGDRVRIGPVECTFQLPAQGGARKGAAGGGSSRWLIVVIAVLVTVIVAGGAFYLLM